MTVKSGTVEERIKQQLAEHSATQPQDWYLVFKARYGLEAVFAGIRQERGPGNVLTQLFTCATAVNPVIAAGLTPVYGEISPDTVALDPQTLPDYRHLRAIVLQNTFGIVSDKTGVALKRAAEEAGALLVEDSAHSIGRMARNADGSPVADISVHSFGVEKMLPTKFGGAVWVNPESDSALSAAVRSALQQLESPGALLALAATTYRVQLGVLNRLPSGISGAGRKVLTKVQLFDPPIAPAELEGAQGSPVPLAPTPWVARQMLRALGGLRATENTRSNAVASYVELLSGEVEFPAAITGGAPLVRFPFFVAEGEDVEAVFDRLRAEGVYAGRWYRPALFPGVADPARYNWDPAAHRFPITEDLIARVVNLPTSETIEESERVARALLSILNR